VTRIRYGCVLFAGFMASLAGAFLSIGDIHTFTEGMTRGAGYLAIASVIFGKWRIGGTVLACLLFGAATALQFQLPALGMDAETGAYKVLRLVTAVDVGKAINPDRCKSLAEGTAVQGLGQAMFEHLAYAGDASLNAEPLRCRVPRITDVPSRFEALVLEQGHGPGPFGAKGVGEAGNLTRPASIANAIADAVGARVAELPLTPDKVLEAIRSAAVASSLTS
jgi:xanthine dehydrogenase molybdopterin-binding subunit B